MKTLMQTAQLLIFFLSLSASHAHANSVLDSFNWQTQACPTEDIIEGKDFNRILAEEFLRAELDGWRNGEAEGKCLEPSSYRYFKVGASEPGDAGAGDVLKVKSLDDIELVSITRFPSETSPNLKLVKYGIKPSAVASGKGSKKGKSRRARSKPPIYGDFIFERIVAQGEYKDTYGCAALYRAPTHLLTKNCSK